MKRTLLFIFTFVFVAGLSAQYQGTPWTGTAWTFGKDTSANFAVGNAYTHKKGVYNGIPHYLYDIGEVDTLKRAGDDLAGNLVAGTGVEINNAGSGYKYRIDQATTDSKILKESDLAAIASPFYAGVFHSHQNRAVTDRSGGWYRYTVNLTEAGNYNLILRCWGNSMTNQAFWFRFYDKNMTPLYPWTRYHPGSGDGVADLQEGLNYLDVTMAPYSNFTISALPAKTNWMKVFDQFTLGGEVIVEYCDPGPTEDYGTSVAAGGSLGEIVFEWAGASTDKFAPVAEPWKEVYDELEQIDLKLSENGTLYVVPDGTAVEDLETAKIDKVEMTTSDSYTKSPMTDFDLPATIQLVTKDAAGNMRFTAPITLRNVIIPDTLQGRTNDLIGMSVSREGLIILVPKTVTPDYASLFTAITTGNADTVVVSGGRDTLVIKNLTGDMNCALYYVDMVTGQITAGIDFQLGEGGSSGILPKKVADAYLVVERERMIIYSNDVFEDLYIYDLLGKQQRHEQVTSTRQELDISDLTGGIYILKMNGNKTGMVTKKFVIN